ncbi:phage holin family protein [Endozoicomonas ascidiicola]|uniref:phage holin family protein n=1 Tax=Endozoicomonas ascidiicola TaxID=1698521 RepID=UPI000829B3CD|nr:phage holin family protein [Endozoicomonas ascidiicola]
MDILLFIILQLFILGISGFIIFFSSRMLSGVEISSYQVAILVAMVVTCLNLIVKPVLLILTLPINVLTLGLFTWVINALILIMASKLIDGFEIKNFGWAMLLSLAIGVFRLFAGLAFPV